MTLDVAKLEQEETLRSAGLGAGLAGFTAALGWISLALECQRSLTSSLAKGHSLLEAIFLFLHFFTIITNIGIAVLMSVTCVRLLRRRPLLNAPCYNAGLIYILVTCVTYEAMLRSRWTPSGMQFFTDMAIHDFIPILMLVFWLAFAPRARTCWRDPLWFLAYPAAYFAMTLGAGALGEGYPYNFFDVDKLGLKAVFVTATLFLAVFYALGLVTTGLCMSWGRAKEDRAEV